MKDNEKYRQKVGMYVSIGIHVLIGAVFFVMMAWTAPDPPIPEYGIEFSMGTETSNESADISETVEEDVSVVEEVSDDTEETISSSDDSSPLNTEEEQSSTSDAVNSADLKTEDIHSPDLKEKVVEEVKKEIKTDKKISTNDGTGKSTEKVIDPSTSNTQNNKAVETKLDDRALFKKTSGTTAGSDAKSASLDMNGWIWDSKPVPKDKSTETGKIIFQITVDDVGEIINVKTVEKTVSPAVEKVYRDAVMELTFSPTSDNRDIAASSTGKITFIIQSK